jgi:hypothetical protein
MDSTVFRRQAQQRRRANHTWRKADIGPDEAERQALEKIDRHGGLIVAYLNGARITSPQVGLNVDMALELNWLVPDSKSPALFNAIPAQRYLVNKQFVSAEE